MPSLLSGLGDAGVVVSYTLFRAVCFVRAPKYARLAAYTSSIVGLCGYSTRAPPFQIAISPPFLIGLVATSTALFPRSTNSALVSFLVRAKFA